MQTINGAAISLPFNNIFSTQPTDRKARQRKIQCNNKVLAYLLGSSLAREAEV